MKKTVVVCLLILCILLSACSAMAKADPQVREMLAAVSTGGQRETYALLHPDCEITEAEFLANFSQINHILGEAEIEKLFYQSISVQKNADGRTEEGVCRAKLDNGEWITVEYCYADNTQGKGFLSFWVYK